MSVLVKFLGIALAVTVSVLSCGIIGWVFLHFVRDVGPTFGVLGTVVAMLFGIALGWILWDLSEGDTVLVGKGLAGGALLAVFMAAISKLTNSGLDSMAISVASALLGGAFAATNPGAAIFGAGAGVFVVLCALLIDFLHGGVTNLGKSIAHFLFFIPVFAMIAVLRFAQAKLK